MVRENYFACADFPTQNAALNVDENRFLLYAYFFIFFFGFVY